MVKKPKISIQVIKNSAAFFIARLALDFFSLPRSNRKRKQVILGFSLRSAATSDRETTAESVDEMVIPQCQIS
jgi:hypothetical protein